MQNPHFSFCKTVSKILHFPLFQKRHRLRHNAKRNSARGFSKLSAPAKQKRGKRCLNREKNEQKVSNNTNQNYFFLFFPFFICLTMTIPNKITDVKRSGPVQT